jgi:hypothetical protein
MSAPASSRNVRRRDDGGLLKVCMAGGVAGAADGVGRVHPSLVFIPGLPERHSDNGENTHNQAPRPPWRNSHACAEQTDSIEVRLVNSAVLAARVIETMIGTHANQTPCSHGTTTGVDSSAR